MTQDFRPSWRRSWAERHPVLFEAIGIVLATVFATIAAAMLLWAI